MDNKLLDQILIPLGFQVHKKNSNFRLYIRESNDLFHAIEYIYRGGTIILRVSIYVSLYGRLTVLLPNAANKEISEKLYFMNTKPRLNDTYQPNEFNLIPENIKSISETLTVEFKSYDDIYELFSSRKFSINYFQFDVSYMYFGLCELERGRYANALKELESFINYWQDKERNFEHQKTRYDLCIKIVRMLMNNEYNQTRFGQLVKDMFSSLDKTG